jgi:hypothetical protein
MSIDYAQGYHAISMHVQGAEPSFLNLIGANIPILHRYKA